MALEASAYAAFALTTTIAFGLISVSAFILLNALSVKLHEKTQIKKLMRTQVVYSMRSTQAQHMRDRPPPYMAAMAIYLTFCAAVFALLTISHFRSEGLDVTLSLLFVTACLGYTALVVFCVGTASRKFVSALED